MTIWPLPDVADWDRDPAVYWPEPELAYEPDPREGPILVTVRYVVPEEDEAEFLEAMEQVRQSRLRTGRHRAARSTATGPTRGRSCWSALYPTWEEHLRQHTGRLTGTDQEREDRVTAFAVETGRHFFPVRRQHE